MNKIDLIIDALDVSESLFYDQTKLQEALQAARELRALKPVAWIDEGFIEWENNHSLAWAEKNHGTKLYALEAALAQSEFDTPESHIVKWSIPVDPNNFGEPITFMGQYVGEGKVVSASFGFPKGAFEFAPHTGKGEASKIKHSLEPMLEQEPTACGYDETVGMCTNNPCCEQTPIAHLWECIGRWSSYLALNGEKANLAPPEWLVDAVKAATAQPEQEPVAKHICNLWINPETSSYEVDRCTHPINEVIPVYTAPPRKEWVGLTDKERNEMIGRIQHDQYTRQRDLIGATQIITEMYLKEKNCG